MFYGGILKLYASDEFVNNLPLSQFIKKWGEDNHKGIAGKELKRLFKEEYWDKIKKEEQEKLLAENDKVLSSDYNRDKEELMQFYSKPSHTYKEYYDIALKTSEDLVRKKSKVRFEVPEVTFTSPDEYKRRKIIQEKAVEIASNIFSKKIQKTKRDASAGFLLGGHMENARTVKILLHQTDEKGDHYLENLKLISTPLTEVPLEKQNETMEELDARMEATLKRADEIDARTKLLNNILSKAITFTESLRNPMSDEEFLEKCSSEEFLENLTILTELQIGNYKGIVETFGVEPSPALKKRWEELSEEFVASGTLLNRLGVMANPLYPEIESFTEFLNLSYIIDEASREPEIEQQFNENGLNEDMYLDISTKSENLKAWRADHNSGYYKNLRTELHSQAEMFLSKDALYAVVASVKIPSIVRDTLRVPENQIKFKDLDNNDINLRKAYDKMRLGETVKVLNKETNKFVGSLHGGTFDKIWGYLKQPNEPANYKIDNAYPEELQSSIKELNSEINDATRWYIKSSKEFKDFRLAMEKFGKEKEFADRNQVKKDMKRIADLATKYIKMKEDEDDLSDVAKKRLEIAHKVADSFEKTLAEASPVLEVQNEQQVNQNIVNNEESIIENQNLANKIEADILNKKNTKKADKVDVSNEKVNQRNLN